MGFFDFLTVKSREQRAQELKEYEYWAFPYGAKQKQKLIGILEELIPEETSSAALAVYLMGREGYRGGIKDDPQVVSARTEETKLRKAVFALRPRLPGKYRKLMSRYLALIMSDEGIDHQLDYPTVEQLRIKAQELEPVLAQFPK